MHSCATWIGSCPTTSAGGADARAPEPLQQARAQGIAWSSYETSGPGRTLRAHRDGAPPDEEAMLDVEVREDGGLRLLVGRLTAVWGDRSQGQAM